jgi:hypothetical protein
MKPNVKVSIEGRPIEVEFIPSAYKENNEIVVQLKDSEEYEEKLNDQITLYKDVNTKEITSIKIHYIDKL